jgi:hypothetical protein|eukprot:TRINITY_DN9621_c0_g1_i1.p1 TRINITY_DN9621_c0_g1~~TRINITY_DN9621_c0_g1_i1.p1  ORF type:complete len:173 (-),score=23.10 TRINITY_DN9621_c0_g1_i1:157-675(-)
MGNQTPIAWIEDVATATGIDKALVHPITGGERVFERDGRISPELVQELESTFSECGLDKIVHLGTGGARAVNADGSFDLVGCLECVKALGEFVLEPAAVGPARAMGMVYKEIINNAIAALSELDQDAGEVAAKMVELKDIADKIEGIIADPVSLDSLQALYHLAEKLADVKV